MRVKAFFNRYKYELLIFAFYLLTRLPSLGHDNFNTDVWKWKSRSYDFGSGIFTLDFEKTIQKYHPGVTLMWAGTAGVKVYNLYYDLVNKGIPMDNNVKTVFELDFVQKLFVAFAIGIGVTCIFYALRHIITLQYAFVATVLLIFEPLYLGLSRVFHLEGMMSTFMLASALWLYYYLKGEPLLRRKRLVISAIFGSLALLTKTSALYLIPFTGLALLLELSTYGKNRAQLIKKVAKPFFQWLGVWLVTCVILWPALWTQPVLAIQTLYRGVAVIGVEREHIQYYFGKLVDSPGPEYYLVIFAFRSSVYLLFGLLGYLVIAKKYLAPKQKSLALYLAIYCFFYFIQLTIPSKKLDRYVIPEITGVSLIASIFYVWVINSMPKLRKVVTTFLVFLPAFATAIILHPDYFSYYNPMFGGLRTGINVIEPKWMIGTPQIMAYFNEIKKVRNYQDTPVGTSLEELIKSKNVKTVLTVAFPEKYYSQISPFFNETGSWAIIEDLHPLAKFAKFFVYPVWEDVSATKRYKLKYVASIKIRGVPVYNVYEQLI